jgi:hypothetical protein
MLLRLFEYLPLVGRAVTVAKDSSDSFRVTFRPAVEFFAVCGRDGVPMTEIMLDVSREETMCGGGGGFTALISELTIQSFNECRTTVP